MAKRLFGSPLPILILTGVILSAVFFQSGTGKIFALDSPGVSLMPEEDSPAIPSAGTCRLRALTPQILELTWISSEKNSGADPQKFKNFEVQVNGSPAQVNKTGFKRRALYAPLKKQDARIGNYFYLELASALPQDAQVEVRNASQNLWPAETVFKAGLDPWRFSPAIHVNQVGYVPAFPKKVFVGYYLGDLGELKIPEGKRFMLVNEDHKVVFKGQLEKRQDVGQSTTVKPYQNVLEADFSKFQEEGRYYLKVPGLGVSLPFYIHEGAAAAFARGYALGLYHQRCGTANELPFSRFTHQACHKAPADIPTAGFKKVSEFLDKMTQDFLKNPLHSAPRMKDVSACLYPFVNSGPVDVSGGHHDAGDYSKYTINSALLIHHLVFAVDALPGVGELDNLGLPESGDGKSDLLEIAKWEADFLAKMQDADGGFYFLVYPRDRKYEDNVLPDQGDPQVVFPKNTAATAAAVAALAQTASSPAFKKDFPEASELYLEKARKGWAFLERAWAKYGRQGAYQKITHYGDTFMDNDEIAWAATELFLATKDPEIHKFLLREFNPADPKTRKWGWWRMFEFYGCAARSYGFADKTGRAERSELDLLHWKKCKYEILAAGEDATRHAAGNAYQVSFPFESKKHRTAGWFFPLDRAFDIAAAYQLDPRPQFFEAMAGNMNFEGGANPNNVVFLTGLGWKRQHEIVHQYAQNDRRILPPSGIPLGALQTGFPNLPPYGTALRDLTYPRDDDQDNPFPLYDRWADAFNPETEFTIVTEARGLAILAFLMAQTSAKNQSWKPFKARIDGLPLEAEAGKSVTAHLEVKGLDPAKAMMVWEASGQDPAYGPSFTFKPEKPGVCWVEAEAQWPDGRRVYASSDLEIVKKR